jgi:cellulose biosynthesis protein BcsQ
MNLVFFIFETIGVIAFSISGALTAMKKEMDIFGACVLGMTTAIGGGIIRDLILGIHPTTAFTNPTHALVGFLVPALMYLPAIQKFFTRNQNKTYDFCLIDCPPSFTAASVAALVCADEVILPVKADAFSRAGALEMIGQVQSLARWHVAPRFRVLVTMADRTRLSRQVEAQLRDSGLDVFETVIPASVCVGEASFARQPLYEYAPTSKAAQGYRSLMGEIVGQRAAEGVGPYREVRGDE